MFSLCGNKFDDLRLWCEQKKKSTATAGITSGSTAVPRGDALSNRASSEKQREPKQSKSLEECIRDRRSIRFYKPEPVPESILESCLRLAQRAPSSSNIQPWRIAIASGPARDRVVSALRAKVSKDGANIPPLPQHLHHFRHEFGQYLYGEGGYGIPREDEKALAAARARNFGFFEAPVCAIVTTDANHNPTDIMTVGLFVQQFILALTDKGLGSCVLVSVTGHPELLRHEFGLDEDQIVLCGIAIGWPMEDNRVNNLHTPREDLGEQVTFVRQ